MGTLGFAPDPLMATMGAQRPATRLKKDATPVPVPLFGAGKVSGYHESVNGCVTFVWCHLPGV